MLEKEFLISTYTTVKQKVRNLFEADIWTISDEEKRFYDEDNLIFVEVRPQQNCR